jgi:hypothetical protein
MNKNYLENKHLLSFLILDFNRPFELQEVIKSIKKHVKFDHQIILNSNGGKQDYAIDLYNQKYINKLILNNEGNGAGYGVSELFRYCNTDWAFYMESDQIFVRDFTIEDLNAYIDLINYHDPVKFVNPVGMATGGKFTLRSFFTNTNFFNEIMKEAPNNGPGPYFNRSEDTNESFIQNWLTTNNKLSYVEQQALVVDLGRFSVNQIADGSVWLHTTDTKQLWLLKGPVKEKNTRYPNFTDEEWNKVLETQTWPDGQIPEKEKFSSFKHWNFNPEFEKNYIEYLKKAFS